MTTFDYSAVDQQGNTHKGLIEADSPRQARAQLRQRQLFPISVTATQKSLARTSFTLPWQNRVKPADIALLTRQLATLVAASMPLEESLQALVEQTTRPTLKRMISGVRSRVLEGQGLASSMSEYPQAFSPLYCASVNAGEQTGRLALVLEHLAEHSEKQQVISQKIQQALIYPTLMTVVSISIVSFLFVFVIPKIVSVFASSGQTLPLLTQILIVISSGVRRFGWLLLLLLIAGGYAVQRALQTEQWQSRAHRFVLRIPGLSSLIKSINTARFARTLSILSRAGVPVSEAVVIASSLITNRVMREATQQAARAITEGSTIRSALEKTGYFSPMTLHLIASGENSARLEDMLDRAADTQESDVRRTIDTGLTLFEPFIIILMGAVVLFIVLAILLPIFALDQVVG